MSPRGTVTNSNIGAAGFHAVNGMLLNGLPFVPTIKLTSRVARFTAMVHVPKEGPYSHRIVIHQVEGHSSAITYIGLERVDEELFYPGCLAGHCTVEVCMPLGAPSTFLFLFHENL